MSNELSQGQTPKRTSSKKIQITERQAMQFNRMLRQLKKIAREYQTPGQLRRGCDKEYGLGYEESLEMAYENLQAEAAHGANGVSYINIPSPENNQP
jgi:hypothetical protein